MIERCEAIKGKAELTGSLGKLLGSCLCHCAPPPLSHEEYSEARCVPGEQACYTADNKTPADGLQGFLGRGSRSGLWARDTQQEHWCSPWQRISAARLLWPLWLLKTPTFDGALTDRAMLAGYFAKPHTNIAGFILCGASQAAQCRACRTALCASTTRVPLWQCQRTHMKTGVCLSSALPSSCSGRVLLGEVMLFTPTQHQGFPMAGPSQGGTGLPISMLFHPRPNQLCHPTPPTALAPIIYLPWTCSMVLMFLIQL